MKCQVKYGYLFVGVNLILHEICLLLFGVISAIFFTKIVKIKKIINGPISQFTFLPLQMTCAKISCFYHYFEQFCAKLFHYDVIHRKSPCLSKLQLAKVGAFFAT